jgi:transposase InsO family protein
VRGRLRDAGIRVVLIPERAPNANAFAERFVRSIKEECLDGLIPIGWRLFRRAIAEYVDHYPRERHVGRELEQYGQERVNWRSPPMQTLGDRRGVCGLKMR